MLQSNQSLNQVDTKMARNTQNQSNADTSQRQASDRDLMRSDQSEKQFVDKTLNYAIQQSENAMSLGHLGTGSQGPSNIKNYGLSKKKEVLKPGIALKKSLVAQRENMRR